MLADSVTSYFLQHIFVCVCMCYMYFILSITVTCPQSSPIIARVWHWQKTLLFKFSCTVQYRTVHFLFFLFYVFSSCFTYCKLLCFTALRLGVSQGDPTGRGTPFGGLRLRHEHIRASHPGHRKGFQAARKRDRHALLLPGTNDALAGGKYKTLTKYYFCLRLLPSAVCIVFFRRRRVLGLG